MKGLFSYLLGRKMDDAAKPRLTGKEAERIARAAAAGSPWLDQLGLEGLKREPGRLFWRFRTSTRGSWLVVDVDDVTGEAKVDEMRGR